MLNHEFMDHLRAVNRALWRQDNSYRLAVLAAPVLLVLAVIHALPGGKNVPVPTPVGPPVSSSHASTSYTPPTPVAKPAAAPAPLKIKPSAALPATPPASSGGYHSPFNQ
ncbi:MAG: hypothetical protein PHI71_01210 [Acidiphilium sp.]|jgi:hypothetical protein|nr:hypothetical protein [Acidiphilium sp.]